jgi:hypothetical protein
MDRFIVIPPNSPHSVQPLYAIPNYCNNLNAIHEAEKTIPESLQEKYLDNLYSVCNQDSMYNDTWKMNRATALQRAEAFLRILGKWEGAK